jgi:hypothetical protein
MNETTTYQICHVTTNNRATMDESLGISDDPTLGNSALERLANASYQIVIEGDSYRQRQAMVSSGLRIKRSASQNMISDRKP